MVSTSRCGRDNPGSNPGHGRDAVVISVTACHGLTFYKYFFMDLVITKQFNEKTNRSKNFVITGLICSCTNTVEFATEYKDHYSLLYA